MTPEIPFIIKSEFTIPRKGFGWGLFFGLLFAVSSFIGQGLVTDPEFAMPWNEQLPYRVTLAAITLLGLGCALVSFVWRDIPMSLYLDHTTIKYSRGKEHLTLRLKGIESASRERDNIVLQMKGGSSVELALSNGHAHLLGSFLTLYLGFRDVVPQVVWKRFTFQDFYAPKEHYARSVRFFKQGSINCYVDCGWIISVKKTTYFFPLPWPDSFGRQHTGYTPPAGFMPQETVVPTPISINLHLLLKTVLVSPIPPFQKETILATISSRMGGGPIFGPLYSIFRLRENGDNRMIYLDVPLTWAKQVALTEVELQ